MTTASIRGAPEGAMVLTPAAKRIAALLRPMSIAFDRILVDGFPVPLMAQKTKLALEADGDIPSDTVRQALTGFASLNGEMRRAVLPEPVSSLCIALYQMRGTDEVRFPAEQWFKARSFFVESADRRTPVSWGPMARGSGMASWSISTDFRPGLAVNSGHPSTSRGGIPAS